MKGSNMSMNPWHKVISSNGIAQLIAVVNSKLIEMTDEEDKIMTDYVVMLIQSGKTEEEINTNLKTFLRDLSGPFVSWLFDHLASNKQHYTSPQPKMQSAEQSNISAQPRSKTDQTESSVNAKSLGSFVGSAKHIQRNPNNIDGEVADNNIDIATKKVFETLGNFHERSRNFDGEVADRNKKRSRPDSPTSQFGNNRIISDTDITTSKRPKLEFKRELPATPVVSTSPTKAIGTPASSSKVLGSPRNAINKANRISVFDRLGERIDPQTKGPNRVVANEGTHTSQNLEARSIVVSNVHYGATSKALTKHFIPCGEVTSVEMLNNISTGHPTGTAVVEFASKEAGNRAMSMDGSTFMYRKLQVAPKSLAQTTTGRENIQSSSNFQPIRDPSTMVNLVNRRNPAPNSNIANSTRPLIQTITGPRNFQWRRDPTTTANLPNPSNPAPSSNTANSARPLAQTTTGPRNFQWRRDPSTDNLTNSRNPAAGSNIDNSRGQPTSQTNPAEKPNLSWKI